MRERRLKIAIIAHGRFDAFDLAKALIDRGEDVTLFTNYPEWAIKRFGIAGRHIRSFWQHGLLSRIAWRAKEKTFLPYPEGRLNKMFGRWAAKELVKDAWDIVHSWSGVSEEVLTAVKSSATPTILMRGSSHIRTQAILLEEEEARCGVKIDRPSSWIIKREEREYRSANYIRVISNFARDSFVQQGVERAKLLHIPSGVFVRNFRPHNDIIEARRRRILSGRPLRVLYVGALSFRKGLKDLKDIITKAGALRFQFRLVGPVSKEARHVAAGLARFAEVIGKQPQHRLKGQYEWADLFIFPTIEDGYAVVLAQAQAAGLPILCTTNCAGPDIISESETGWVLPIRDSEAFMRRLRYCDENRIDLSEMVNRVYENRLARDWRETAADFTSACENITKRHG